MGLGVYLPHVVGLARRIEDHVAALCMLVDEGWFAFAVCTPDAEVQAWDGWYSTGDYPGPLPTRRPSDLDWDEWDDVPFKLLHRLNAPWLSREVGEWLMPSYSVTQAAVELIHDWGDIPVEAPNRKRLPRAELVAYLPVVADEGEHFRTLLANRPA